MTEIEKRISDLEKKVEKLTIQLDNLNMYMTLRGKIEMLEKRNLAMGRYVQLMSESYTRIEKNLTT